MGRIFSREELTYLWMRREILELAFANPPKWEISPEQTFANSNCMLSQMLFDSPLTLPNLP